MKKESVFDFKNYFKVLVVIHINIAWLICQHVTVTGSIVFHCIIILNLLLIYFFK